MPQIDAYTFPAQVMYSANPTGTLAAITYGAQFLHDYWEGVTSAHVFAAQVMFDPAFDGKAYTYAAQVLHDLETLIRGYTVAAQVMHYAQVDPSTGTYLALGRSNQEEPDVIYYDVIFPECISYGSTGVPRYQTEKAEVLSGSEQRNTRWSYPKHEYSINMENLPADELSSVLNIWHVVRGDYAGFLFMDPQDHTSSNTANALSGTTVDDEDQLVAAAIGGQLTYPLYKEYQVGSRIVQRRIKYPKDGTIVVAVDGYSTTQWAYDYDNCLLTWDTTEGATENVSVSSNVLVNATGNWNGLEVGDLVTFSGFVNGVNNSGAEPRRVTSVSGANLEVEEFNGTSISHTNEAATAVTWAHATPPTDAVITAGFYFYVPVRFDGGADAVSEIQAGLRESSFTTLGDIKLKEIFE